MRAALDNLQMHVQRQGFGLLPKSSVKQHSELHFSSETYYIEKIGPFCKSESKAKAHRYLEHDESDQTHWSVTIPSVVNCSAIDLQKMFWRVYLK